MTDLRLEWSHLEAADEQHLSVRQVASCESGPVFVGVDGFGARHLLVPTDRRGAVRPDRRSRGVVLGVQQLEVDGRLVDFADLVCADDALTEVFVRLAEDVLVHIDRAEGHVEAGRVGRILSEWRDLLRPSRRFGREEEIGLFGELEVLIDAVGVNGPAAFSSWAGPSRSTHDFASSSIAVEIKTSAAREGRRVEVHGLEQLEVPGDRRLLLAWIALREDPAGLTLHEQVERCLRSGVPRAELMELISPMGYDHDEAAISDVRWMVRETAICEVDDDFPRITAASFPGGIPAGIESLRYVVDLAAAGEPLSPARKRDVLAELVT